MEIDNFDLENCTWLYLFATEATKATTWKDATVGISIQRETLDENIVAIRRIRRRVTHAKYLSIIHKLKQDISHESST